METINSINEWNILVNGAKRRRARGVALIEDEALLDVARALNFLASRVQINDKGELTVTRCNALANLNNLINHARDIDLKA